MIIDPTSEASPAIYKLMTGSIVPRPIALVSSVGKDGVRNLAPFSFFNGVCSNPPIILFSTSIRKEGSLKDTLLNIEETKEFVVNVVSEEIAEQMSITSADYSREVDEFEESKLTPVSSDFVQAPRVQESKISMECRLVTIVRFGVSPGAGCTIFGEVVRFHVADELFDDFRIDFARLRAIGRMSGSLYVRTDSLFEIPRPKPGGAKTP